MRRCPGGVGAGSRAAGLHPGAVSGSQAEYRIADGPMHEEPPGQAGVRYGKDKLKVCEQVGAGEGAGDPVHPHPDFQRVRPGDHPWSLVSTLRGRLFPVGHMDLGTCTQQWNFLYIKRRGPGDYRTAAKCESACIMWRVRTPAAAGVYIEHCTACAAAGGTPSPTENGRQTRRGGVAARRRGSIPDCGASR